MDTGSIVDLYKKYVMPTYARVPLVLAKGKGAKVWDAEGNEYLDFFPGWAVSGIGHCHPRVASALAKQAGKIMHVSNNYYSEMQGLLAKKIIELSFPGKVFFANSGAEANECAIKLARKYGNKENRYEIITMVGSFHGRTLATIAATGQDKVKIGFDPLPEGFRHVPFNDFEALKDAITDKTVAVMLEPIQGEGGINIADKSYLENVRKLCDDKDMLLIFDEVQTGMGRCGKFFAYQHFGIQPDVMTLAKSLGSGVPIGAAVASERVAYTLTPSSHASTFGGSPICSSAALATFEAIEEEGLLENAVMMGDYIKEKLGDLKKKYNFIKNIKGVALMIGVELDIEGDDIYKECLKKGLLINCTQNNILRIMPPLVVTKEEVDKAISILDKVFEDIYAKK
ncbi:MAG: aspartate aminotransferase family protein [Candidatus Omnitrophota bacterium]